MMVFLNHLFTKNKFMEKIIIGIDISGKTLDICIKKKGSIDYLVIENRPRTIRAFFRQQPKQDIIVAMENTGRYNWNLYQVLEEFDLEVYVISPLHLKRSLGLIRGKNDRIDALRICNFIERNKNETTRWRPTPLAIKKIKILLAERGSRIKMKRALLKQQHDYGLMKGTGLDRELLRLNKEMVRKVELQTELLEKKMEKVLQEDTELERQAALIRTVPGVGKVLSWTVLAKTEGFTLMDSPRKMACYCGIVPFEHRSGTSIERRPRVSHLADKQMKSILHLAAMSAIRLDNDLGKYYRRKTGEGKNKMSVLNAVRNKIIHRIFAVIKNQTAYKNSLVLS